MSLAFAPRTLAVAACVLALVNGTASAQALPDAAPDLQLQNVLPSGTTAGQVYAMLRQSDGRVLVGGRFNRANGGAVTRTALLRLERDGSIDPTFAPVFGGLSTIEVYALAVSGGAIYAGGFFETVNGVTMRSVVRLRADGSIEPGFASPFSTASGNQIQAIALGGTGLFLGGDTLDGDSFGLVRLDAATGVLDAAWRAQLQFSPTATPIAGNRGEVTAMRALGDDLIVAGQFGQVAGVARQGIARVSQSAPVNVRAFNAGISGRVDALVPAGAQMYIAGNFFHSNPNINYAARIDATTGAFDPSWITPISGAIFAMHRIGDHVYLGGSFSNQPPGGARLARVSVLNGTLDGTFAPLANDSVLALADNCYGRLHVGGTFGTLGAIPRAGFAAVTVPQLDCIFHGNFEVR